MYVTCMYIYSKANVNKFSTFYSCVMMRAHYLQLCDDACDDACACVASIYEHQSKYTCIYVHICARIRTRCMACVCIAAATCTATTRVFIHMCVNTSMCA